LHVDAGERSALLLEAGTARVVTAVDALLLRATQLFGHLVDGEVEGDELVAVIGFCADDGPLADEREFDGLIRNTPTAIGAMSDFHIQSLRLRGELLDPGDLLLDNGPKAIGDSHPDADDACFHCCLLVPVLPAKGGPWSPCEPLP